MAGNTVTFHRVIKCSPEKLYRAFTEPLALASWIPPYGFVCEVHEMKVEVGGSYKASFQNFTTGKTHSFGGKYVVVQPNERLQYTDVFDDPNLPGEMTTTIHIQQCMAGAELHIKQEGIPEMIPVEMCYLGWQDSIDKLIKLVEPVIND